MIHHPTAIPSRKVLLLIIPVLRHVLIVSHPISAPITIENSGVAIHIHCLSRVRLGLLALHLVLKLLELLQLYLLHLLHLLHLLICCI